MVLTEIEESNEEINEESRKEIINVWRKVDKLEMDEINISCSINESIPIIIEGDIVCDTVA